MNANVADLRPTVVPKSDQLNADDMIGGPMTITVTGVRIMSDEQPVAIDWEGGAGRPFKPCKSMRRLLIEAWGADATNWPGHGMTLYRDPKIRFGPDEVGGIRISHLSHIEREMIVALTVKKGKRTPFRVMPLKMEAQTRQTPTQGNGGQSAPLSLEDRAKAYLTRLAPVTDLAKVETYWKNATGLRTELGDAEPELLAEITQATADKRAALAPPADDEPDGDPIDPTTIPGMKRGSDLLREQEAQTQDDDDFPGDR